MKADQFKVVWATAADRLEADRATLKALEERDVQTFADVGNAPADLKGQVDAVLLLPPPGVAMGLEDEGEKVLQAVLAAGVPACAALRTDLTDRAAFERRKARLVSRAREAVRPLAEAKRNGEILSRLDLWDVLEEFSTPEKFKDPPLYKTGLADLDEILGGGLREGVYVLQGIPGGGKTALSLYIAGSILKGNQDARVLYHSLEMSRRQIAAKVLTRLAFDLAGEIKDEISTAMEPLDKEAFADKHAPKELDWQTPSRLCALAAQEYGERVQHEALDEFVSWGSRFLVAYRGAYPDGCGFPGINRLADIGGIVAGNGPAPVVFVDYLQLITPPKEYQGERRDVVGYNSSMLEQMAHALRTPVVVISSMNRASVRDAQEGKPVGFAAKESGDVDYNADAILSIVDVLDGVGQDAKPLVLEQDENDHRRGKVVEIQVAKNRTGRTTHKGTHPRLDWLTAWGVYETRHEAPRIKAPWEK